jgi:uncharacterized membrane protein YfcA
VGAIASAINAVAGGGSLVSFPFLTVPINLGSLNLSIALNEKIANATNSVGLFPGSLSGAYGFRNLLPKTGKHLKFLVLPTTVGSLIGALLLLNTSDEKFAKIIPFLVLVAAIMLLVQPKIRAMIGKGGKLSPLAALTLQTLVSVYGGFFGAGMGIMMLACFALYIEGNVHELNAVKNWLSLLINVTCSIVFLVKGLVVLPVAFFLLVGAVVGGFIAARVSQKVDPNKLRLAIAVYGLAMAAFFAYRAYF